MSYEVAMDAAQRFQQFIRGRDTRGRAQGGEDVRDISYEYLDGFLWRWLTEGDAVDATGGDFSTYLLAVIVITELWSQDPNFLDYSRYNPATQQTESYPRRATYGFQEEGPAPRSLDQGYYNIVKFGKLTGAWPAETSQYT